MLPRKGKKMTNILDYDRSHWKLKKKKQFAPLSKYLLYGNLLAGQPFWVMIYFYLYLPFMAIFSETF